MIKVISLLIGIVAITSTAILIAQPTQPDDNAPSLIQPTRGQVIEYLHDIGKLSPSQPVLVMAPIDGPLQWIVDDGSWVDVGDEIYVIDDESVQQKVSQKRYQLLQKQQEYRLAVMRLDHERHVEALRLSNAEHEYKIATIRHRILTTHPQGGRRLIELHEQLQPLEQRAEELRLVFYHRQTEYQQAQDQFLSALEVWHNHQDSLLRIQSQMQLAQLTAHLDDDTIASADKQALSLSDLEQERTQLEQKNSEILEALEQARSHRNSLQPMRDQARDAVDAHESSFLELQILAEIEKRGVDREQIRINLEIAQIDHEQAAYELKLGQEAYDSGVISKNALDKLIDNLASADEQLTLLQHEMKLSEDLLSPEERAEANAAVELAQVRYDHTLAKYDRDIERAERTMKLREAELKQLHYEISLLGDQFPSVLQQNISFAERELQLLEQHDPRKQQILKDIAKWNSQLVIAQQAPPNVILASAAGVVRIDDSGGRVKQPGDDVRQGDTVARIFASENMHVELRLNETDVSRVHPDMPVQVVIPALGDQVLNGKITHISAIGADKFIDFEKDGAYAGVTEFVSFIEIEQTSPDFRQGMSCHIAIELARLENVVTIPRSAVNNTESGFVVRADHGDQQAISGRYIGADLFLVESGLDISQQIHQRWESRP